MAGALEGGAECGADRAAEHDEGAVATMRVPDCERMARVAAHVRILSGFAAGLGPLLSRFRRDAHGATAIEYALIAGLIFLAVVGSLRTYASRVNGVYDQISPAVSQNN